MINKKQSSTNLYKKKFVNFFLSMFVFSNLFSSSAKAAEDSDILEMTLPSILSEFKQAMIITIPINYPRKKSQVSCGIGMKCDVYFAKKEEVDIQLPENYKACAAKINYSKYSRGAYAYVRRGAKYENTILIGSKVPCGGGGMSLSGLNKVIATGITATVVYFSGGSLTSQAGTISEFIAQTFMSSVIEESLNTSDRRFNKSACGVRDEPNELQAQINILLMKQYISCPHPDFGFFRL